MEWHDLECPACGYKKRLVTGTPSPEESFDLNEDFSHYRAVLCAECNTVTTVDVFDKQSEPSCPCGGEARVLTEEELRALDCPACRAARLEVKTVKKD